MAMKTEADRTEPPMDGAMLGIARELSDHGDRLAMLEKQALQDRKVIRGMLVLMGKQGIQDQLALQALQDRLDR